MQTSMCPSPNQVHGHGLRHSALAPRRRKPGSWQVLSRDIRGSAKLLNEVRRGPP